MIYFTNSFPTPLGPFSTAVDEDGILVATAFGPPESLRRRMGSCDLINDESRGRLVREQVLAYCEGETRRFALTLAPRGTAFQQRVWAALQRVPFGETRTYGQIAAELGNAAGSRAVGRANATNPICLIVPCHRVIGANGALTGFAFGEDIKRRLLEHERTVATRSCATMPG